MQALNKNKGRDNRTKTKEVNNSRASTGVGYVIMPSDVERERYISNCLKTSTITLLIEGNSLDYVNNVKVSKQAINDIIFPESYIELGSCVIWVKNETDNYPIVVGVVNKNDQISTIKENTYEVNRGSGKINSYFNIDGNTGEVNLFLGCYTKDIGKINIKVFNPNGGGQINLECDGDVNVISDSINAEAKKFINFKIFNDEIDNKETILKYEKGVGLEYKDEFENEITAKKGEVKIISDKIVDNRGNESALLGNKTIEFLDELINLISTSTTATLIGAQPLSNAPQIAQLRAKLEALKSRKTFLE